MPWEYEPDEKPKRKHAWDEPYPGFVEVRGEVVGKCPAGLSNDEARELLNQGIAWTRPRSPSLGWPDAIYVVHAGAVYRAKPTNPGVSYHAFPETGERLREVPRSLRRRILDRARELGCEQEVRRWMNA
ncbi:MAG: hypothetical protein HY744_19300 [Deltaproteobacteria bacterium]|nr:hypothetical protein [Deltaproteobacteria bacterium]